MTLLFRYLLQQFLRNLLIVSACFLAIYLLIDFFEKLDDFWAVQQPLSLAVRYLFWRSPEVIEQIAPVSILLGGVLTLGILHYNREYLSLLANGVSLNKIVFPLLAGACLVSVLVLASSQWYAPRANAIANQIYHQQVRHESLKGIQRQGRIFYKGQKGIYSFKRAHKRATQFTSFIYTEWDEGQEPTLLITAASASWDTAGWTLKEGVIQKKTSAGEYEIRNFDTQVMALPEELKDIFVPEYKVEEMSISQLRDRAQGIGSTAAWMDFYERLSYIALGLPLLILGLPVFLIASQRWSRDISLAIPVSCALAFAAWGGWGAVQSITRAEYMQPFLGAWGVHLLVSGLGVFLLARQQR